MNAQTPDEYSPGDPAARWPTADHEARRALVVDVALDLLADRGAEGVTMRAVAQRLGVGAMTLYTYVQNQQDLQRAMIRRGFDMLHGSCQAASTLGKAEGWQRWRGGAMCYLRFAIERPHLYKLMFDVPLEGGEGDADLIAGGLAPLLGRVREQLAARGLPEAQVEAEARRAAGRFWIALHGLATLAIAGRLGVLQASPEQLLDDLLQRVAPA